jgi:trigger factor
MQVSVEAGEGLERRMTVELPFEQVASEMDKRLQKLSRGARLPGFRPGKVPMNVLRKRYGDAVRMEVFGELVESSFADALAQESLRPAAPPSIEPNIDLGQQRIAYTATFEVLPQVQIASLADRSMSSPVSEITEDDVETMIQTLRRQRRTWTPVERPAAMGDRLTIDFAGRVDGASFEGGSGTGVQVELGAAGMIAGFEAGLVGAAAGDQRTLDLVFPDPYQMPALAGKPVQFEVTVTLVEESVLPEVDAAFLSTFGIEDGDLERFRADLRKDMEREMERRLASRRKEAAIALLLETHQVELPRALVEGEIQAMAQQMRAALGMGDLPVPGGAFDEAARRRVALGLIIGEIVKQQGLTADPQRVRAAAIEAASTYENPQALVNYFFSDPKNLRGIESLVLEDQVVEWVMGQVRVQEETVTFTQLTDGGSAFGAQHRG